MAREKKNLSPVFPTTTATVINGPSINQQIQDILYKLDELDSSLNNFYCSLEPILSLERPVEDKPNTDYNLSSPTALSLTKIMIQVNDIIDKINYKHSLIEL